MTDQVNLNLIWANTGGTTPVSDIKYETGWIAEIPTYQNFNWAIQTLDKNTLHFAEEDTFNWQNNISYQPGARVKESGQVWTCKLANSNQQPSADASNNYWVRGTLVSGTIANYANFKESEGLKVQKPARPNNNYSGVDQTVVNNIPLINLQTTGATDNWAIGNMQGELVGCNLGQVADPDGRSLAKGGAYTFRLFHEGHKPLVSEVPGAVPEAPTDGALYARVGTTATSGQWVEVTSTTVSSEPPPANTGAGQGWYNLDDGMFYIDINDGDSSQWVIACPPLIPVTQASQITFLTENNETVDVETGLQAILAKSGRKNYIINGGFDIWQRGTSFVDPVSGTYTADRWTYNTDATGGSVTVGRQELGFGHSNALGTDYFLRIDQTSATTGGTYSYITNKIGNVDELAGRNAVLSFWAKSDATRLVECEVVQNYGTGGTPSPLNVVALEVFEVDANWSKYEFLVALPSNVGKTKGTDGNDCLEVRLYSPDNLVSTMDYAQVQIEEGNLATGFENKPEGVELILCQNYFQVVTDLQGVNSGGVAGSNQDTHYINCTLPVKMRKVPTAQSTNFVDTDGVGMTIDTIGCNEERIFEFTTTSTVPSGRFQMSIELDAEIY